MTDSKVKEQYEPPRIRKVKLVPDELAVTACKSQPVFGSSVLCNKGGVFTVRTIGS